MKRAIRDYWQNNLAGFFRGIGIIPLAVLLVVGATLSWVAYDEYLQTLESEFRLLESHARNADVRVAEVLNNIDQLLNRKIEERSLSRPLGVKSFTAMLDFYRTDIPELGTLLVIDADGHIHAATDAAIVGRNVSREPYFTAHLDHARKPKLFMSRPDKSLLGVTAITFTLPIVGADQNFSV